MDAGQRLREVFRDRPVASDIAVAVAITVAQVAGLGLSGAPDDRSVDALAVVLVVVPGLLTVFRRTNPIPALAVATVLAMTYWIADYAGAGAFIAIAVLLYSSAVYTPTRGRSTRVLALFTVTLLAVLVAGYVSPDEDEVTLAVIVFNLVLFQLAWLAGDAVRTRRAHMLELQERFEAARVEQDSLAERAVDAERSRIARELHDVVAHAMSVIVVQAEGARRLVGKDDDSVRTALAAIEQTGRSNLNDIRGIVGLLRTDGTEYAPSPELSMIDRLVEQCSEAGLTVTLDIKGARRTLPPMIELSGYRIVQESLTNAMKHAGPAARATVLIEYRADALEIAVIDNGRGAAAQSTSTPGHGLVGIRERVEAFGGCLATGPRTGGGFAVEARIPLEPAG